MQSEEELIQEALACRPDLHAAKWAVAAASERSRLSRWLWLRLDCVLDVRDGPGYTPTGSGLRLDVPIFNRNEGGILRADWELNGARHNQDAISDQIVADVRTAYRQLTRRYSELLLDTGSIAHLRYHAPTLQPFYAFGFGRQTVSNSLRCGNPGSITQLT